MTFFALMSHDLQPGCIAKLRNPVLDTVVVVLAVSVALSERFLLPLLVFWLRSLESLVQSLESETSPLPSLQIKPIDYELVEADSAASAVDVDLAENVLIGL